MFRKFWSKVRNEKGFTLVELLVVVAIIGILVGIAIPVFSNINQRAANSSHEANERILKSAGMMAFVTHGAELYFVGDELKVNSLGKYIVEGTTTTMAPFLEAWPELPSPIPNNDSKGPAASAGEVYQLTIKTDGSTEVEMIAAPE